MVRRNTRVDEPLLFMRAETGVLSQAAAPFFYREDLFFFFIKSLHLSIFYRAVYATSGW
jgi:hypothetical protein